MTDREPPTGPPPPSGPPADDADGDELAAERAGVAYWRNVAHERRVEAARVQRRPIVRAAVALDRRSAGMQDATAARARQVHRRFRAASVVARGWVARATRDRARRHDLDRQVAALGPTGRDGEPGDGPRTLVVHLGPRPDVDGPRWEVVAAADLDEVSTSLDASNAELVAVVGPDTEALTPDWLARLVRAVAAEPDRLMAVPLVVHPRRPWRRAGPDDLAVRWAGLGVELSPEGAPRPVGIGHGEAPDLGAGEVPVPAATSSALVMGCDAFAAAGGLHGADDAERAIVELCLAHRAAGGTVRCVSSAAVIDRRPVDDPEDLRSPLRAGSPTWRALVDDHGPALRSAAGASPSDGLRIALTTATPSAKIAPRSGDWHYAGLLARALERAGHHVRLQTIAEADSAAGRACDLHVVLRGLEPVRATAGQRHVLWIISHPEAVEVAECDAADLVLVASPRFADHLRARTTTPVEVLLQATDPDHFRPVDAPARHRHPVTVVANTRGVVRAAVADAVAAGLEPAVYGTGWEGVAGIDLVAPYAPFPELPEVYAGAGVVLNDHWETMRRWGFVSNRIFDVAACARPVLSDHVPEVIELFGDLVPTWRDPDELRALVDAAVADPDGAQARADAARALVVDRHTFDHRARELLAAVERHAPVDHPVPW